MRRYIMHHTIQMHGIYQHNIRSKLKFLFHNLYLGIKVEIFPEKNDGVQEEKIFSLRPEKFSIRIKKRIAGLFQPGNTDKMLQIKTIFHIKRMKI